MHFALKRLISKTFQFKCYKKNYANWSSTETHKNCGIRHLEFGKFENFYFIFEFYMKNKNFNLGLEYKMSYFLYFFRKKINIKTNTVENSNFFFK